MTKNWKALEDTALIIVDPQNDFCPGGRLAVNEGDKIIPVVNALRNHFSTVVLTQDWHPEGHSSFASAHAGKAPFETAEMSYGTQVLWPDHCVQGSDGAAFRADLNRKVADLVLQKGTHQDIDSYSAFYENDRKTQPQFSNGKTFAETMRERGILTLVFSGLAFDYCVGWNAYDAKQEGFNVVVVKDATRPIAPASEAEMEEKLKKAGVVITTAENLPKVLGL